MAYVDAMNRHQFNQNMPRLFDPTPLNKEQPYEAGHKPNPNFEQPGNGATIGKYLYHHSSPRNRSSIMKNGLEPRDPLKRSAKDIGYSSEQAPEGVYMGPHAEVHHSMHDVWAIDTNQVRTQPDPDDSGNYFGFHYSENAVPSSAMKLIHKGTMQRKQFGGSQ